MDEEMRLNHADNILAEEWRRTETIRDNVQLEQSVIMPNHFHGILAITGPIVGAIHESPLQKSPRRMTITQRRNMTLSKLIG